MTGLSKPSHLHVLGRRQREEGASDELVSLVGAVAEHAGEGGVHFKDSAVDARVGDTHRGHHEARPVSNVDVQPCKQQ